MYGPTPGGMVCKRGERFAAGRVSSPATVPELPDSAGNEHGAGPQVGIGASTSPTLAGYLTDHFGSSTAFLGLR